MGNAAAYHGQDRRQLEILPSLTRIRLWGLTAAVLAVAWGALVVSGPRTAGAVDATLTAALLQAAATTLLAAIGIVCFVRWKLTGEAAALVIAVAVVVVGVGSTGFGQLLLLISDVEQHLQALVEVRAASRLTAIGLFGLALFVQPVDTRLRPGWLFPAAAATVALLATALEAAPGVAAMVAGLDAVEGPAAAGTVLFAVIWSALAAGYAWHAWRRRNLALAWAALVLGGFAVGELALLLHGASGSAMVAVRSVRLLGVAAGLAGVLVELERAFAMQSQRLLRSVVETRTAQARIRSWQATLDERAHEAANALSAIEGATRTLHHFHDRLDPDTRETLMAALGSEINRLHGLLRQERQDLTTFRLRDVVSPQVSSARARGAAVVTLVPDVEAVGRPNEVAQVLANVFENALRHAPGAPITLHALRRGDEVLIRVEDEGPGIPAEERDAVFRRGVRGSQTRDEAGSGLGLYVSALLMRDQGGDLWVEEAAGGGAAFVLRLPAAPPESDRPELVAHADEDRQQLVDRGQVPPSRSGTDDVDAGDVGAVTRERHRHRPGGRLLSVE